MKIQLLQPQNESQNNVPNTCFVVVRQLNNEFPSPFSANFGENSILIQSSDDYVSLAKTFGFGGDYYQISEAYDFLMENLGKVVEDPGYFSN